MSKDTLSAIDALPQSKGVFIKVHIGLGIQRDKEVFTTDDLKALAAELRTVTEERDELKKTFDMVWEAEQRGIQMWRDEKPEERKTRMPDIAHFVMWLLNRIDFDETVFTEMKDRVSEAEEERDRLRETLGHYADTANWKSPKGSLALILWRPKQDFASTNLGYLLARGALKPEGK